jgi:hypothetical protein
MAARFRSQAAHPRLAAMAMRRYAALLRSVTTNAKMPDLRRASEAAGFTGGRTLSTSGNVVFDARPASDAALQRKAEAAMTATLGRSFLAIVRSLDALREIVDADPCAAFELPAAAKRVVTFLRDPPRGKLALPVEVDGPRIPCLRAARCSPRTSERARPGVHDADREDARRCADHADLGHRGEGGGARGAAPRTARASPAFGDRRARRGRTRPATAPDRRTPGLAHRGMCARRSVRARVRCRRPRGTAVASPSIVLDGWSGSPGREEAQEGNARPEAARRSGQTPEVG